MPISNVVVALRRTVRETNRSFRTVRERLARLPKGDEPVNVMRMAADEEKTNGDGNAADDARSEASDEGKAAEKTSEADGTSEQGNADQEPLKNAIEVGESEAKVEEAETKKAPSVEPLQGASWAKGFVRFERALTFIESRLLFVALMALVFSLVFWISLRGMATPLESKSAAGITFRMFVGAAVLGGLARGVAVRALKLDEVKSALMTVVGIIVGIGTAFLWRAVGIAHFDAILNWLQEGSSLTMIGGLRGLSTRLTVVVALIGAALAAARSKHINIDVVLRFMRPAWRKPVHVLGAIATATVCFVAAYGFFDYSSIEGFGQNRDTTMSEKIAGVRRASSTHRFVLYKQIRLDLRAFPDVVFGGMRWDAPTRMNGRQWNAWLNEAGFAEEFSKEEFESLKAPPSAEDEGRVPMVTLPGEASKGILSHDLDLIWPLGLFWIGLRVILRALLVISGHASVEPDADEPDEDDVAAAAEAAR
jgi:Tripartite ATP-independent periplasmic transporters, DctQ component